jgi:hypothetical protein
MIDDIEDILNVVDVAGNVGKPTKSSGLNAMIAISAFLILGVAAVMYLTGRLPL